MFKKILFFSIACAFLAVPVLMVSAQGAGNVDATYINKLLETVYRVINNLIPILIGIGILFFLWFAFKLVRNPGNEEAKTELLWAVIFLAVALSVWGLVGIIQRIFGVEGAQLKKENIPQLPDNVIRNN